MSGYRIEFHEPERDRWVTPYGFGEVQRGYGEGYLQRCREEDGVRLAVRLVRAKDGAVIDEVSAREDVGVGMVAGFPTWQQYARGAARALESALRVSATGRRLCGEMSPAIETSLKEALRELRAALAAKEAS